MGKVYVVIKNEYGYEIDCVMKDKGLADEYAKTLSDGWVEEYDLFDKEARSIINKNSGFHVLCIRLSQDYKPKGHQEVGFRYQNIHTEKRNTHSAQKITKGYFAHHDNIDSTNDHYRLMIDLEIPLSDDEEERNREEEKWANIAKFLFVHCLHMFFVGKMNRYQIDDWLKIQLKDIGVSHD